MNVPFMNVPSMRFGSSRTLATIAAIAAVVTVAVVVLAFDLRREIVRTRSPDAFASLPAQRLAARAAFAAEQLLLAERRDSIAALLVHREWPVDSMLVLTDPALPAWRVQASIADLRREWTGVQPAVGGYRVAAVVIADTLSRAQGAWRDRFWGRASQFLPAAVDGRTCVVLEQLGHEDLGDRARRVAEAELRGDNLATDRHLGDFARRRRARAFENTVLGPCAFLAAFGPPGSALQPWLDSTGWQGTAKANWQPGQNGQPAGYETYRGFGSRNGSGPALSGLMSSMFDQSRSWSGHACAAQERGACLSFVLLPARWDAASAAPGLLSAQRIAWSDAWATMYDDRVYRDPRPRFLADLLRTGGRERFERFWRASGTLPEAYAAVYGRPADDAWREWVVETIGGPAIMGPTIARRGAFSLAVIAALGVLFGAVAFSRRQAR